MTKIFYLVVATLTLTAAAVQWLPKEGLSPNDLNFVGVERARAQSPSPFPSTAARPTNEAYPTTAVPSPNAGYAPPSYSPAGAPQPTAGLPYAQSANPQYTAPSVAAPPQGAPAATPYAVAAPAAPASFSATPVSYAGPAVSAFPGAAGIAPQNESTGMLFPTQELEGAKILARVGGDVIFAGEVLCSVNSYLARNGVDYKDPEVIRQRDQLVKMRLQQVIDTRIIVNEARRKIPEEGYKKAMEKFDEEFDKTVVPQMLKERKLENLQQLEAQLRRDGTTLEREKRAFAESVLRSSWVGQAVKVTQEVTHEQMLDYYQKHAAEFEFEAFSKWEQITMKFEKFPNKAAAYAEIARVGNMIVDGKKFEEVAKAHSQHASAPQGGEINWTKRGSLVSVPLDTAVFNLPIGVLSHIIEDDKGFHIVRVTDRREAGKKPFTEVQAEIKKKINEERTAEARVKYVEEIKKKTTVWTIYDEQDAKSKDPQTADRYAQPVRR